jgi:pimeloyl-ACP methyl ester carboxylesterase
MTSRYVQTNGIRLHYLDQGPPGSTLILLPGLTANAHSFDGLVAAGLANQIKVLALDLRGRGETDQPDTYTLADHAADVLGFLDSLEIDRVVLGGHSFGGLLTYYLAANHPGRISRCVVIDAPAQIHPEVFDQIKPSLDRLDVTLPSWDHYLQFIKRMPYFADGWWDPTIEGYFRADVRENADGTVRPRSRPEHIRAVIDGFKDLKWLDTVRRITQPVLFLRAPGAYGPLGSPAVVSSEQARVTVENLQHGRLVEVPGNHMTMLFGNGATIAAAAIADFVLDAKARDAVAFVTKPSSGRTSPSG